MLISPLDEVTVRSGLATRIPVTCSAGGWPTPPAPPQWAVPGSNTELYTTPGKPPTPTIDTSRTTIDDGTNTESVVWRLAVRNTATVPRSARMPDGGAANYNAYRVTYNETYRVTGATGNTSTPTPKVANCELRPTDPNDDSGDDWDWDPIDVGAMSTDNNGIAIASGTISQNPPVPASPDPDTTGDTRVAVCVQAVHGDLEGPWVMSRTHEVKRQPPPS